MGSIFKTVLGSIKRPTVNSRFKKSRTMHIGTWIGRRCSAPIFAYLKSHRGKYYQRLHDRPKPESRGRFDDWEGDLGRFCMSLFASDSHTAWKLSGQATEFAQCSVPNRSHHSRTHIYSLRDGSRNLRSPCELKDPGINRLIREIQKENPTWIAKRIEKAKGEVWACCVRQSESAFFLESRVHSPRSREKQTALNARSLLETMVLFSMRKRLLIGSLTVHC